MHDVGKRDLLPLHPPPAGLPRKIRLQARRLPIAESISNRTIALPFFNDLTERDRPDRPDARSHDQQAESEPELDEYQLLSSPRYRQLPMQKISRVTDPSRLISASGSLALYAATHAEKSAGVTDPSKLQSAPQ